MNTSIKKLVGQFLCTIFALGLVPALYINSEFDRVDAQHTLNIKQSSQNQIEYSFHELAVIVEQISNSVPSIADSQTLLRAVQEPSLIHKETLQDLWVMLARGQKYYSQLRYLDLAGNEVFRVNYKDGQAIVVPDNELQNKSSRDYYEELQRLKIGEVSSRGIDLEVENGEIVRPLIPALRIMTPVAENNHIIGYFIANLNMLEIYKRLHYQIGASSAVPIILNKTGHIIMGPDPKESFGHVIESRSERTYAKLYPELWTAIQDKKSSSYFDGKNWYFHSDISPNIKQFEGPIYMVLHIENQQFSSQYRQEKQAIVVQIITLSFLISMISAGFVLWNSNHKKNSIESQLAKAAMNGMSALVITDRNNRIIKVNQEFTRVSGYSLEDVKGHQPSMFASGRYNQEFYIKMWSIITKTGVWEGEVVNRRKDGSLITEILRIQTIKDSKDVIQFYVASFVDISKHKELENKLRNLSEKDSLAGCWNRRKFDLELRDECSRVNRYPTREQSCLAILDIDYFKRINDRFGHDYGDRVIQTVAKVLQRECRETDFVARIGGEEFGVILPHTSTEEAEYVLNRLRVAVSLDLDNVVTVSGGITNITSDPALNYKCADLALYEAKAAGRNQVCLFLDKEMSEIA
ncbi:sensor domain-containing diguanylate cyclase [Vibrio crassostreae]|uniref:sensor domain-containing diguanylate cyclase n=1 Tax=Vibrio crassostreae TaxID=246167 RepID=UPI00104D5EDF|nr:diguanylate cyclase [Vibrio crassostreae]TCN96229.1 PAS domain S-box-containing protein/diguanylate cyclase (GGDEF)-like protein [Vibrio crassostreae]CAK1763567.1 PAS domain S-box-containing protein/diguanylate cyclase (GGDEF)-like protein [Vibrio crassostreae]CAK1783904.1 PAS domain S-box-containing protein/diguanylate cyclase (GGDEF)-like protein [Vibrio crassostreae]CAK2155366.1 PAS domain S-box-containing protein/diguanylate cyclase (GGDEF)-like protein [Vibrio crassostreae]CAK2555437.1